MVYDTGFIPDVSKSTHRYSPSDYSGLDPISGDRRLSEQLGWDKHYHWHVRYRDSSGNWSEWCADDPNPHQDFFTPAQPYHSADLDEDQVIGDFELLDYIDQWASGQVDDFALLDSIDLWAAGQY